VAAEIIKKQKERQNTGREKSYLNYDYICVIRLTMAGHVARMGRRGMHIGYWREIHKERDHWEDQDVGGWAILK
jgi:hypothetical protein